jgi:glycosyltransferase involved in cell wall biosynthesis
VTRRPARVTLLIGPSEGGIGRHVARLDRWLTDHGHDVVVVAPHAVLEKFAFDEHRSVPLRLRPDPAGVRSWVRGARAIRSATTVHAHGLRAGALAGLLAGRPHLLRRPRLVVSWHNAIPVRGWRRRLFALGERFTARTADVLVGASQDLTDRARSLGTPEARTIEVPAPPQPATRGGGLPPLPTAGPLVVTVGRLAPQKNLTALLDVAALVGAERPDVVFVVAGEGPERASLQRRIVAESLPVRLIGDVSAVDDLLRRADVFLLTSHWEARALVVQEAMRAGVPVVVPAVGGLPGLVEDGGVVVAAGDVTAMARELVALLDDPDRRRRLGQRGRTVSRSWPGEQELFGAVRDTYAL